MAVNVVCIFLSSWQGRKQWPYHRGIMNNIEMKATSQLINFGHLSFECLLVVCTAAVGSKWRGVNMYSISDFYFKQKISYSAFVNRVLISNKILIIETINGIYKITAPPKVWCNLKNGPKSGWGHLALVSIKYIISLCTIPIIDNLYIFLSVFYWMWCTIHCSSVYCLYVNADIF
jgi:hypothetical protein